MNLCLICARKGSKRLPNKNLLKIKNKSLLRHSIEHAMSCPNIDKVVVSTDCPSIADEGKKYGAQVPFLRPKLLSGDKTPEWKVWQHALTFYNNKNYFPTSIVILPTTAPLRKPEHILSAIELYSTTECDGVISVTESHRNPTFNMVKIDDKGYAKPAIEEKNKIYRTQDTKQFFDITTVCYVMKPDYILRNNHLFDGKIKINHIPKEFSIDIDTNFDFEWAKFLMEKN